MLEFIFISGPDRGKRVTFDTVPITIGRNPSNKFQINSPFVSSYQGEILEKNGQYIYRDLESRNGANIRHKGIQTHVNGRETVEFPIENGDELIFCNMILGFKHDTDLKESTDKPIEFPVNIIHSFNPSAEDRNILNKLKQEHEKLVSIYQFSRDIDIKISLEEIFNTTVNTLFNAFPCASHCLLVMFDKNKKFNPVLFKSRKVNHSPETAWKSLTNRAIVKEVIRKEECLLFSGKIKDKTYPLIRSGICVPLRADKKIIGAIQVDNRINSTLFSKDDLNYLNIISYHIAIALERQRLKEKFEKSFESLVATGAHTLDMRDPLTAGHSIRVQMYTIELARDMGLSQKELEKAKYAAVLHDFGKIAIPDEILKGNKKLTDDEYAIIRKHAFYTKEILSRVAFPEQLSEVPMLAACHHERLDGKGPLGIKGDEIPLISKIIAVADVFDALTSARTYKKTMSMQEAADVLIKDKGTAFEPEIVDAFLKRFGMEK